MTAGGMDADTDDCMDAVGRATHDAKAERTRMYPQRVMGDGFLCHYAHNIPLYLLDPVTAKR